MKNQKVERSVRPDKHHSRLFNKSIVSGKLTIHVLIFVVPIMLAVGVAVGYYIGVSRNTNIDKFQKNITPTLSLLKPTVSPKTTIDQCQRRINLTKESNGVRFISNRVNQCCTSNGCGNIFEIIMESGKNHPTIYSFSSQAFGEDGLFDIVGRELWVVNGQMNRIDVYKFSPEKKIGDTTQLSTLIYDRSVELPKYQIGKIFSAKCDFEKCTFLTAQHQESGCSMDYSFSTGGFSKIKCSDMTGDFSPKPL
jgi:hypothetical protein